MNVESAVTAVSKDAITHLDHTTVSVMMATDLTVIIIRVQVINRWTKI